MREKVLNFLNKLDKLDSFSYSYLVRNYGEKIVNSLIDDLIKEDSANLLKFDYYVKEICVYDDDFVRSDFAAYLRDISVYPVFDNDDNKRLLKELFIIIERINKLLEKYSGEVSSSSLLSDRVDYVLKNYVLDENLCELKELYGVFCEKRNEIVLGNLKFVIYVCKKYLRLYNDLNVLVQYGNMGLMQAIEKYDVNYDTAFITYAYYWIRRNILINISFDKTKFKVSYNVANLNMRIKKAEKELSLMLNRCPTIEEVANYLKISIEKVKDINLIFDDVVSFNSLICDNDDDMKIMDCLREDYDLEDEFMKRQLVIDFRSVLRSILSDNEYNVICHRYEIDNCEYLVLEQLGNMLGYCKEGISKIERRALKKIRENGKDLAVYLER